MPDRCTPPEAAPLIADRRRRPRLSEELAHRQLDAQVAARQKLTAALYLLRKELGTESSESLETVEELLSETEERVTVAWRLQRERWQALQYELERIRS